MAAVITNSNITIDGADIPTLDGDTIVLDDANNRVGIGGVSSPSVPLQVNGNINATNNTNSILISGDDGSIEIQRNGSPYIDFKTAVGEDYDVRLQQVDNGFTISTGGNGAAAERMRIDNTGNVGIGTSSPSSKLHVNNGSFTQQFTDSDLLWTDINSGANPHTPMSNELVIRNDALNVTNSMASIFFMAGQTTEGLQINTARIAALREGGFITSLAFSTRGSGGHSERMRINSSGNVGIGTSSPATELDVNGTIQDSQGNVRALKRTGITSTPYALPANSSGKYFSCNTGAGTITIDAGDCETGQIITIYNQLNTDITISWTNMSSNVFIAGDTTSKGTSGSVTLTGKGLVTIINDVAARLIFSGNVS